MPKRVSTDFIAPAPSPRVDHEELLNQFRQYRLTHDIALRDAIVCAHLALVHSVARKFTHVGEPLDDLIQEGSIGLLNAVDHFDPERGVRFSTYACHLIISQIQHYLRDCGHLIRQPAWVQELNMKVSRMARTLEQELGREATPAEIAVRVNLTEESVQEVLAARELNRVVSLTVPQEQQHDLLLIDKEKIRARHHRSLRLPIEDRISLEESINNLKSLEQQVIRLFFYGEMNQSEIARKLGISVNYSSYLLHRSIDKLKAGVEAQRQHEATVFGTPPSERRGAIPLYDQYTGVYSQAHLYTQLAEELTRSQTEPVTFTLMLVQIQGITSASKEAQLTLASIGQALRSSIHATDLVAYLGNQRFALLLLNTGSDAQCIGERLCRDFVLQQALSTPQPATLTINVGYAIFPIESMTQDALFQNAEQALAVSTKAGPGMTISSTLAGKTAGIPSQSRRTAKERATK